MYCRHGDDSAGDDLGHDVAGYPGEGFQEAGGVEDYLIDIKDDWVVGLWVYIVIDSSLPLFELEECFDSVAERVAELGIVLPIMCVSAVRDC